LEWNEITPVPVLTLDALIERHGSPQFIKIDVEGFETDVLAGLSQAPKFLSFEFNSEFMEGAITCVTQDCFPSGTEFNISLGESMQFISNRWSCGDEVVRFLRSPELAATKTHGDIVARRKH